MEIINKVCMACAFCLGAVLLILGVIGFFMGSSANFTLPPILGLLPALFGWGALVAVRRAWEPGDRRRWER